MLMQLKYKIYSHLKIFLFLNFPFLIKSEYIFEDDYNIKFSLSSGFIGYKSIDLIRKRIKASINKNKDDLKSGLTNNILICLGKLNFKLEIPKQNTSRIISIKPLNFNYNPYYIEPGCIDEYPGPNCIMRRVGICSIGYGYEFYYKDHKNILSQNIMLYANLIGKKIIPFDLIISYSPIVISLNNGFYIDFNIINFSVGTFIKGLVSSFKNVNDQYGSKITSDDDEKKKKFKEKYRKKIIKIQKNRSSKLKYIFIESLLMNIINNMQIFIGIKFDLKL